MAMTETPGDEVDWMCSMPGVELTELSMMLVTEASTMSGLAPGDQHDGIVVIGLLRGRNDIGRHHTRPARSGRKLLGEHHGGSRVAYL